MNQINGMFEEAEDFNCTTFCESVVGFVTANMIYMCKDTRYERVSSIILYISTNAHL